MKIITLIKSIAIVTTLAVNSLTLAANIDANIDGLAIEGFDTASCFTDSKATKESHKYAATYKILIYKLIVRKIMSIFKKSLKDFYHNPMVFVRWIIQWILCDGCSVTPKQYATYNSPKQ